MRSQKHCRHYFPSRAMESSRRIKKLRNLLDRSQRATDNVTSIVTSTDAQLSELHSIMAPIQERTQCLSNAHKNLSRWVGETFFLCLL